MMAGQQWKRARKVLLWLLGILLSLVLIAVFLIFLIQTKWGGEQVRKFAQSYLSNKLKTEVNIGGLELTGFKKIGLYHVRLVDQQRADLLSFDTVTVDLDITGLTLKKIHLPAIRISNLSASIYRSGKDGPVNYQYIVDAFSSGDTTTSSSSGWDISFNKIHLSRISFTYDDIGNGDRYHVAFNSLGADVKTSDLDKMNFQVSAVELDSLFADMVTMPSKETKSTPSTEAPSPFSIAIGNFIATRTNFNFKQPQDSLAVSTIAKELRANDIFYDKISSKASIHAFMLSEHATAVRYATTIDSASPGTEKKTSSSASFSILVDTLSLVNNGIRVRDVMQKKVYRDRFDVGNIELDSLQLQASQLVVDSSGYKLNIRNLSFRDQNGFELQKLQTNASYSDTNLALSGLILQTKGNLVKGDAKMSYKSIGEIISAPASTKLQVNVIAPKLNVGELSYFSPDLKNNKDLQPLLGKKIYVDLKANGSLDELVVNDFTIKESGNVIRGKARVHHPTDSKRVGADLSLTELRSSREGLKALLPAGLIADSIWAYVPESFMMTGTLSGSMSRIESNLRLRSSYGDLSVKGYINNPSDKFRSTYDLAVGANEVTVGKIMKDTTYGDVTGDFKVKGRGYDPETAVTSFDATVASAFYKGYTYKDVDAKGSIDHQFLQANLSSADPNLDLDADASVQLGRIPNKFFTKANIRMIDLKKLGFLEDSVTVKGKIDLDFPVLDSSGAEGNGLISGLVIGYNDKDYFLDTISAKAYNRSDSQFVVVNSAFVDIDLKGQFSFDGLSESLSTMVDNYIKTEGSVKTFTRTTAADLTASFHIPDSMTALVPGLKKLSPFKFRALVDTRTQKILAGAVIPELIYRDFTISNLTLGILDDSLKQNYGKAFYAVQISGLTSPSVKLYRSSFGGTIEKGVAKSGLLLMNEKDDKIRYGVPFTIVNDPIKPYLSLQDTLILNETRWRVNENNRVYLNPKKLSGSNLSLSNGDELLTIHSSDADSSGLPLKVNMRSLQLASLSGIINSDSAIIKGALNGDVTLNSFSPLLFTSTITADSLSIMGSRFGDLKSMISSTEADVFTADVKLMGAGNNASLKGSYNNASKDVNLDLNLQPLSLEPLRPFLVSYVDSLKGNINGNLAIRGTTEDPLINGKMTMDSSYAILKLTGTELHMSGAELRFQGGSIVFDGMKFYDSAGNPALLQGTVRSDKLASINYDLRFSTDRFLVAGHRRYPEQMISGPLYTKSNLTIKGDEGGAAINGSINVLDSSSVTYIYTASEEIGNKDGLLEFFDPLNPTPIDTLKLQKKIRSAFDLDVSTNINITPKSTVTIVLDELTGDKLQVKGNANFNFTITPTGLMELVGNYEVESGTYDLSIGGIIKKQFSIEKGSTLTWSGDILKATVNLTALYKVKTDAAELVQDIQSVPGISKQKFDFLVYMELKGQLLKPDIDFRLDMLEKDQAAFDGVVYTRLKQVNASPSELNKQVMGLLALNGFIADNPFNSLSGSGNFETQAFSTAGNLLTQELNDFIGDAVKDVDIDIGLDIRDDYTSGSAVRRSDLKVGIAKSFSNNRLNIYVGNTFALENENQQTDLLSGLAGDVSLEYLLTSDGRLRLKGYRLTKQDMTFNGTVVETGVTFVVVIEFNRFKNAFRSGRSKNKKDVKD
jgi:hypothetical protein